MLEKDDHALQANCMLPAELQLGWEVNIDQVRPWRPDIQLPLHDCLAARLRSGELLSATHVRWGLAFGECIPHLARAHLQSDLSCSRRCRYREDHKSAWQLRCVD